MNLLTYPACARGMRASLAAGMVTLSSAALAGPCSVTAADALAACESEAVSEYSIHLGNCRNILNTANRDECFGEATEDRDVALAEECPAVHAARLGVCALLGDTRYDPKLDPESFLDPVEIAASPNGYFPLVPGNRWVYRGTEETVTVTVTGNTRRILGIPVIVVRDVVRDGDGVVVEDTEDWYAQHVNGDIWYMGELAKNLVGGRLRDLDGSWQAGRAFAKPGILLEAAPAVGDAYRQEFLLSEAEDIAEVVSISGAESAPGGSCSGDCLVTRESSPLEPEVYENKYYLPGTGLILELDPVSGERLELLSFTPGAAD